eukprot:Nk52_evm8s2284 gene=Nk52_evmTU8s2284
MGAFIAGQSIGNARTFMNVLAQAKGSAAKIFGVVDLVSDIDGLSEEGLKPLNLKGDITFKDVSFAYPSRPTEMVLRHLNMTIPKGSTVAIVGYSGSGKSTVVSLLERFYSPTSGAISLAGAPIEQFNVKHLRNRIGLVGQEPVLFSMSIKENILLGRPSASFEEVLEAARQANALEFINALPDKFDTNVGEGGSRMSGGQKQRIAIARAVIRNPDILLLDEATSALDTKNEILVQKALDRVSAERTTIVVAHRLATVRKADHIMVFKDGQIHETGTHSTLVAQNGIYAEMANRQMHGDAKQEKGKRLSSGDVVAFSKKDDVKSEAVSHSSIAIDSDFKIDEKTEPFEYDKRTNYLIRLLGYHREELWYLTIGVVFALGTGVIFIIFAFVFSEMINSLSKPRDEIEEDAFFWSMMFLVLAAGGTVITFVQNFFLCIAGSRLASRLRKLTFEHILKMDVAWFDRAENATGALTSRLANDSGMVEGILGERLAVVLSAVASVVSCLVMAFVAGPILTLIVIGTLPVILSAPLLEAQLLFKYLAASHKAYTEGGALVSEGVSAIRTVASLGCEGSLVNNYSSKVSGIYKSAMKRAHISGMSNGLETSIGYIAFALGFWQGAAMVAKGDMSFSNVLKVVMAITFTKHVAKMASQFASDYGNAKVAIEGIFDLLDQTPSSPINEDGEEAKEIRGRIEFKNVVFGYSQHPEHKILNGISFVIQPGEKVAIVGSSGCGKSTIVSLLERFYEPENGQILIDDIDIRRWNRGHFRKQIGLVGQEPVLFTCSISNNITYGKADATIAEVREAAQDANASKFISELKDGYDTLVGHKGLQLSGGQKQRIAIERSIIRTPNILLLDEATSALDGESERIVQQALDVVSKNTTTLIVAHRLSTIQNADRIIVLQSGTIVETGSHQELLRHRGGVYSALVSAQIN